MAPALGLVQIAPAQAAVEGAVTGGGAFVYVAAGAVALSAFLAWRLLKSRGALLGRNVDAAPVQRPVIALPSIQVPHIEVQVADVPSVEPPDLDAPAAAKARADADAETIAALAAQIKALESQVEAVARASEEVARAKDAAEAANRAKTEFLAMMSHELRTPLNAILGFSEIIRAEALGPLGAPEYKEYAGDIYTSGAHLLALINDLLDLAKVESGMVELREERIDVAGFLDDGLRVVAKTRAAHGVKLMSEPADRLPRLRGDRRKLHQVLINLLSNAVKFTPEGKSVVLRAYLAANGGVVIEVADSGIGIAPEDIERAMQPFVQIDSSLSRAHQGTGLGLPLCKQLVELHGGRFELESAVGDGTVARVIMPPARSLQQSAHAA